MIALLLSPLMAWAGEGPSAGTFFPVVISTYGVVTSAIISTENTAGTAGGVVAPTTTTGLSQVASSPDISSAPQTNAPARVTIATPVSQVAISTASNDVPVLASLPIPPVSAVAPMLSPAMGSPAASLPSTNKLVSLDLRDMDVIEVLKLLSKQQNINLIIDKNVSGRVTLILNRVQFWEALKAILNSRDLAYAKKGDLVEIMAGQDYERVYGTPFAKSTETTTITLEHAKAKTVKDMLETARSKVGTIAVDEVTNSLVIDDNPENVQLMKDRIVKFDVPREMRVFRLNYANVDDMQPKIAAFVSKEFGNMQIDKRSNSILIEDNPARLEQIAQVIKAFDVRDRSVLIEVKIMQVLLNKSFQSGVNWSGVNWSAILTKLNGYHAIGALTQNTIPSGPVTNGAVTAQGLTASVGILEKPNFNAVINLLDSIGTTNLLSAPRVMALNNQEAKIHVGSKAAKITKTVLNVGSTTSNPVTTSNVEFLDTGVKLSVIPTIGDDGTVTMRVKPEVSSVESTITTDDGSSIPIIRVSEAEASLVVKDGVTVVLGGLMEDSKAKTDTGVPILQRIPLIGMLFRTRVRTDQKTELVIFLTPHIVTGDEITPEVQTRLEIKADGTPRRKGFFRRLFGG